MVPFNTLLHCVWSYLVSFMYFFSSFYRELNTCVFQRQTHHLKTCKLCFWVFVGFFFFFHVFFWRNQKQVQCVFQQFLSQMKSKHRALKASKQAPWEPGELPVSLHSCSPWRVGGIYRNQTGEASVKLAGDTLLLSSPAVTHGGWDVHRKGLLSLGRRLKSVKCLFCKP